MSGSSSSRFQPLRTMVFCDGSNFLTQLGETLKVSIRADKPTAATLGAARRLIERATQAHGNRLVRQYWFGSYQGSEEFEDELSERLRAMNFDARLFRRRKGREKGVDIALTLQMLVNAFHGNFDVAIVIAGDEDYLELVEETKRYGCQVWGAFVASGLAPKLKLALDHFIPMNHSEILDICRAEILAEPALANPTE